ncbi:MAG: hypothetical protein V8R52_10090 [Coprobacter fastidiosus]
MGEDDFLLYRSKKNENDKPIEGVKVEGNLMSGVKDALSVPPNNPLYSPYYRTFFPFWIMGLQQFCS